MATILVQLEHPDVREELCLPFSSFTAFSPSLIYAYLSFAIPPAFQSCDHKPATF